MGVACTMAMAAFVLFLLHCLLRRGWGSARNNNKRLPPSPRAIPFLGHLHLVEKPFHAALSRLAARHAPIISLRLGSRDAVVVSSAAYARECFTDHDVTFANRPRLPSQQLVSFGFTSLVASNYGAHWRDLRRIATVQLLSAHRVDRMSGVISAHVHAMARRLSCAAASSSAGGAARVELKRKLFELSLGILMETIVQARATVSEGMDVDSNGMSVEAREFKNVMDEIVPLIGTANLWDYLPVLRWFDVGGLRKRLVAAVRGRDAFIQRLIDVERQRVQDGGEESDEKSMVAVLLSLQKTVLGSIGNYISELQKERFLPEAQGDDKLLLSKRQQRRTSEQKHAKTILVLLPIATAFLLYILLFIGFLIRGLQSKLNET